MTEPLLRHVAATVHGRMLVRPQATPPPHRWFVGFHGYGQNAEIFMDSLAAVPGAAEWLVASVQALHPFYTTRGNVVVANWMTRQDRELAIADNIAYADLALDELEREFGAPRSLVVAGFSQGVAMAYRTGAAGRRACDAILAVAGDVPPELKSGARRWPRVRIVVGDGEGYYKPELMDRDVEFLKSAGADVRTRIFAGGHEWSADVLAEAGTLLKEVSS